MPRSRCTWDPRSSWSATTVQVDEEWPLTGEFRGDMTGRWPDRDRRVRRSRSGAVTTLLFARRSQAHHLPRFRGSEQCSPVSYARATVAQRGVPRPAIDQRCLRASQRMRAIRGRVSQSIRPMIRRFASIAASKDVATSIPGLERDSAPD